VPIRVPAVVRRCLTAWFAGLALAGCQTLETYLPNIDQLGVYKLDINQGNFLSEDMVNKLKSGQTKPQVRAILGTPLLNDVFHESRWDYIYEFMRHGKKVEHRRLTVYFVDDKLARWEGDEMPPSAIDLNRQAADRSLGKLPSSDDKGFLESIIDFFKRN